MFTGLVEKTAKIADRQINSGAGKLTLTLDSPFQNVILGESIAVNGVCLTVEEFSDSHLIFHVLEETFSKTNLGEIPAGAKVNLERALALGDRLGGHMVSGHVDTTAEVREWLPVGNDFRLSINLPDSIKPFLVSKGSIAIDGVSLTIVDLTDDFFSVHLIPTTLKDTALQERKEGDKVNLEADIIGKYVVKQLTAYTPEANQSNVTIDSLLQAGW